MTPTIPKYDRNQNVLDKEIKVFNGLTKNNISPVTTTGISTVAGHFLWKM
jgi:hypothetical protein